MEKVRIDAEVHVVELSDPAISSLICHRSKEDINKKKLMLDKLNVCFVLFVK